MLTEQLEYATEVDKNPFYCNPNNHRQCTVAFGTLDSGLESVHLHSVFYGTFDHCAHSKCLVATSQSLDCVRERVTEHHRFRLIRTDTRIDEFSEHPGNGLLLCQTRRVLSLKQI